MTDTNKKHVEFTILPGLPGSGKKFQFHSKNERFVSEGLVVEFRTDSLTWIGNFKKGTIGIDFSTIFLAPNSNSVYVIAGGEVYVVNPFNPEDYDILLRAIINAFPIYEIGLSIFVSFTDLIAYDMNGIKWETGRISADWISVIGYSSEIIRLEVNDFTFENNKIICIDPSSGLLI